MVNIIDNHLDEIEEDSDDFDFDDADVELELEPESELEQNGSEHSGISCLVPLFYRMC